MEIDKMSNIDPNDWKNWEEKEEKNKDKRLKKKKQRKENKKKKRREKYGKKTNQLYIYIYDGSCNYWLRLIGVRTLYLRFRFNDRCT